MPTTPPLTTPVAPYFPSKSHSLPLDSLASRLSRPDSVAPLVSLPSKQYIELSERKDNDVPSAGITPKLLVLDLNGAIIYRTDRTDRNFAEGRKAYPRPYLSCFLEYLFLPEPLAQPDVLPQTRPWEVFVWSSAQPVNVRTMVELGFGTKWIEGVWDSESRYSKAEREKRGEGRLLGVWARDKLGLTEADYRKLDLYLINRLVPAESTIDRKVQTVKDLRKPIAHLQKSHPERPDRPPYSFDESTIVLLDDSPLKAVHQPWSQIVIPEYGKVEYESSIAAALRLQENKDADRSGLDEVLLGVIGILDELRAVQNVPAWVRDGGLIPKLPVTVTKEDGDILPLAEDADDRSDGDFGGEGESDHHRAPRRVPWKERHNLTVPLATTVNIEVEPTIPNLPSDELFVHWYQDPAAFDHWTQRGKEALIRKGIESRLDIDETRSASSPRSDSRRIRSDTPYSADGSRPSDNNHAQSAETVPADARRLRRWSPSRPASADPVDEGKRDRPPSSTKLHVTPHQARRYSTTTAPVIVSDAEAPASALNPVHIDRWRAFRAIDVSRFLADVADRPSPLDAQHRAALLQAANVLLSVVPDSSFDEPVSPTQLSGIRSFPETCETCTLVAGQKAAERRNKEVRAAATAAGLEPNRKAKGTLSNIQNPAEPNKEQQLLEVFAPSTVSKTPVTIIHSEAANEGELQQEAEAVKEAQATEVVGILPAMKSADGTSTSINAQPPMPHYPRKDVLPPADNGLQTASRFIKPAAIEQVNNDAERKRQSMMIDLQRLQMRLAEDSSRATQLARNGLSVEYVDGQPTLSARKRNNRLNNLAGLLAHLSPQKFIPNQRNGSFNQTTTFDSPHAAAKPPGRWSNGSLKPESLLRASRSSVLARHRLEKLENETSEKTTICEEGTGSKQWTLVQSRQPPRRDAKDRANEIIHEEFSRSLSGTRNDKSRTEHWTPSTGETVIQQFPVTTAEDLTSSDPKRLDFLGHAVNVPSNNTHGVASTSITPYTEIASHTISTEVRPDQTTVQAVSKGEEKPSHGRSKHWAESVVIGEKRRLEMLSEPDELELSDEEIARLLFQDLPEAMDAEWMEEVEEERMSKRHRGEVDEGAEVVPA